MYNKLQYITQGENVEEQLYNIHQALDNGCDRIQMRFKNQKPKKVFALAQSVKFLCEEYLANFIINDDVHMRRSGGATCGNGIDREADGARRSKCDVRSDIAAVAQGADRAAGFEPQA